MSNSPQADESEAPSLPARVATTSAPYTKPHFDHGHSLARWTAVAISSSGFLVGGVAFPFHLWSVVYVGGALQLIALIVVAAMNAAGYGVPDVWGELKAEATANRGGNDALPGGRVRVALPGQQAAAQVNELAAH